LPMTTNRSMCFMLYYNSVGLVTHL